MSDARAKGMSVVSRSALVLVGAAAYLGFAVLAFGGAAVFFSHPPLVALAVVLLVVAIVAMFAGGSLSSGVREDRSNRWVLTVFAVDGLLLAFLPAWTDRVSFWTIDGDATRWCGVVLFAVGCALRVWPVFVLGYRFSGLVAIQPGHTLATRGIYSVIRHPSYLGLLIGALGWALAFRSGAGIVLTACLLFPLIARMNAEEALLASEFHEAYDAYRKRTSRLLPGLY